jgi:hypothetical protein
MFTDLPKAHAINVRKTGAISETVSLCGIVKKITEMQNFVRIPVSVWNILNMTIMIGIETKFSFSARELS